MQCLNVMWQDMASVYQTDLRQAKKISSMFRFSAGGKSRDFEHCSTSEK